MSREKKWAPGPWFVQEGFLTVYTTSNPETKTGLTKALFKDCGQCDTSDEEIANAHLIASAPELLDALEALIEWHEKCSDAGHRDHEDNASVCGACSDIVKANRAIAKAYVGN